MPEQSAEKSAVPVTAVVVVAGGSGVRFGRPEGKQLAVAAGHAVLWWSVRACAAARGVSVVVLVCPQARAQEYSRAVEGAVPEGVALVTAVSGKTRQESVATGLALVPQAAGIVVVHDGARPLVTTQLAESLAAVLAGRDELAGVVVGHPSVDTLKLVDGDVVVETPDRSRFWQVQTPQVFRREALLAAHARAAAESFLGTDDASLVERDGGLVAVVNGPRDNIKVTHAEDLAFVEAVLSAERE